MDATNTQTHKRTLAVCLAALIVTTSFAIVHAAAGRPHEGANAQNTMGDVIAQSRVATAGATIDSDATNESGQTAFHIENASMVSPDELGVWVNVTYPVSVGADVPRYIAFTAAINGKLVEKTFDVTGHTTPGVQWGKMSASGVGNEMFDARGDLKPTTPLRIKLHD